MFVKEERSEMKLVIDIPEGMLDELHTCKFPIQEAYRLCAVIENGKPLPKGHGKIVDIKPLMIGLYEGMGKETFTPVEIYKMLDEECRVIIEADEEGAKE